MQYIYYEKQLKRYTCNTIKHTGLAVPIARSSIVQSA